MKVIRWWGVAVFFAIVVGAALVWYLLAPGIIQQGIEKYGSPSLGAKVELKSVELSFFPLAITLNQLAAANPDQPLSNLFQAEKIRFAIDSRALLWKKLVIDELTVAGVKTGEPRKTSGKISERQAKKWEEESVFNFSLPEIDQQAIENAVSKIDLITLERIQSLKNAQHKIASEWDLVLDEAAFKQRTDGIKNAYVRLAKRLKDNPLNILKDRTDWKKLRQSITTERNRFSQLNEKLKTDRKQLSAQFVAVKAGPEEDVAAVKARFGLSNRIDGVIDQYLGAKYRAWIYRGMAMVKGMNEKTAEAENGEQKRIPVGNRVYFHDAHTDPDILVKKVGISGMAGERKLAGLGTDLGYLPWLTGRPAKLDLYLDGKGSAKLSTVSHWSSEAQMSTRVNLVMDDWLLQSMRLMETPEGAWLIESGNVNAKMELEMTMQRITLNAILSVNSPIFKTPEGLSGWQTALASSMSQQTSIDFTLAADGTLEDPNLKISSNIAQLFTQAVGEKVKEKAAQHTEKIEKAIADKVGDISSLTSFDEKFDQWDKQLLNRVRLLESLLGKIKR